MSKITKKQLHNGWHSHDTEIIKMKKELRELKQSVLRLEKLTDEKLLDKPQLKQVDQSVFDGLDEKWRFASVDKGGAVWVYSGKPDYGYWFVKEPVGMSIGRGYDTSNWQNSLIERSTAKELTGSELCLKLLNLDRDVMCDVKDGDYRLIFAHDGEFFISHNKGERECHERVTPINSQGEPLTASEVGL